MSPDYTPNKGLLEKFRTNVLIIQVFTLRSFAASFIAMENGLPSDKMMLQKPEWAKRTMEQLQKDAALCGIDWPIAALPTDYESWIALILKNLIFIEKQSPALLSAFLYRVDIPEKLFIQYPFASEALAEAVLKRAFLKVWFKSTYRQ